MRTDRAARAALAERLENIVVSSRRKPAVSYALPLFHYTDSRAFKAIVEGGRLWATDVGYMNDASELSYGYEVLSREISRRREGSLSSVCSLFLERAAVVFKEALFQDFYVTCFCENDDLLSQWRGYGTSNGYAIGFHHGILRSSCVATITGSQDTMALAHEVVPIIYDPAEQTTLIGALLDEAQRFADAYIDANPDTNPKDLVPELLGAIRRALAWAFVSMKHPSFEQEKEWRLVYSSNSFDRLADTGALNLRVADGHLVPYLDVQLRVQAGIPLGLLPIESLMIGPTATPKLAEHAAIALLRRSGYNMVAVRSSKIPLRR